MNPLQNLNPDLAAIICSFLSSKDQSTFTSVNKYTRQSSKQYFHLCLAQEMATEYFINETFRVYCQAHLITDPRKQISLSLRQYMLSKGLFRGVQDGIYSLRLTSCINVHNILAEVGNVVHVLSLTRSCALPSLDQSNVGTLGNVHTLNLSKCHKIILLKKCTL